jgi:hypothetical protein
MSRKVGRGCDEQTCLLEEYGDRWQWVCGCDECPRDHSSRGLMMFHEKKTRDPDCMVERFNDNRENICPCDGCAG